MNRRGNHYSEDLKKKMIDSIKNGVRPSEIAMKFGIARASLYRWLERDSTEQGLKRSLHPGSGKAPILSLNQVNRVLRYLSKPASSYGFDSDLWTTTSVRALIKEKLNIKVHRTTVYRMLTEQKYSSKKPEFLWNEADKYQQEHWIKSVIPSIKKHVANNRAILYFCDESAISLTPSNGRTCGPKGTSTILKRTSKHGRLNVISAISPSNRLTFSIKRESIGSKEVVKFLKQLLKNHKNRNIVVVLDNASSHHSKLVRAFEAANKNLKIYYLPAYSPEWNPDEKVWNHLKSIELVGHNAKDLDSLECLTRRKLQKISRTPKLLRGIFMRCEVAKFFI